MMYAGIKSIKEQYWTLRESARDLWFKDVKAVNAILKYFCVSFLGAGKYKKRKEKNIALLAWYYPPMITGGVYRALAFTRYASQGGWDLDIMAGPRPERVSTAGAFLLDQVPPKIRTRRIEPLQLRWAERLLPLVDGEFKNVIATVTATIEVYGAESPVVIYASGPPFHNFIAGSLLARYYRCKLILEYRDEWSESPFDFVAKGVGSRFWEIFSLRAASLIIFTTESQLEHARARFPILRQKRCEVIHNGWDPAEFTGGTEHRNKKTESISIAFVGNLANHTLPGPFLTLLKSVLETDEYLRKHFEVVFVGNKSPVAAEQLLNFPFQGVVKLVEQLPKPAALALMGQMDGLLILNNTALHRYIPGKLFEYLAMDVPVVVYGSGGEVGSLVSRLNAGLVVGEGESEELKKAIYSLRCASVRSKEAIDQWRGEHRREILIGKILDAVREVTSGA